MSKKIIPLQGDLSTQFESCKDKVFYGKPEQ
jgi:hypothetical protein